MEKNKERGVIIAQPKRQKKIQHPLFADDLDKPQRCIEILKRGAAEMGKDFKIDDIKAPETNNNNKEKYEWNVKRNMMLTGCPCPHHRPIEGCDEAFCGKKCPCKVDNIGI
jgi:hypothetical protein